MKKSWEWEREDLENLIGQMESMRLEFKSSGIFRDDGKIAEDLSKPVSAFANSEGGILVIGIEESKGKAVSIDQGVEMEIWNPHRVQQIIESNISPLLRGIRVKPIFSNGEQTRCAYVIDIPQGTTAYQAKDHKYYGRSEYEVKSLPDHEIRLRMFRGKAPSASILINNFEKRVAYREKLRGHRAPLPIINWDGQESSEEEKPRKIDGYRHGFDVLVKNSGEINITQFKVELSFSGSSELLSVPKSCSPSFKDGWTEDLFDERPDRVPSSTKLNIYPGDKSHIERKVFYVPTEDLSSHTLVMRWKIYLKDTFPISGEVNVIDSFRDVPLSSGIATF